MGNFLKSVFKGLGGVASFGASMIPGVGQYLSKGIDGLVGSFGAQSDANASLRAQYEMLKRQQDFAHNEAQLNRDFQKQMFDETNAYNSPQEQVKRYVAAGLNPSLMYGGSMSGAAASAPSGSMASSPSAPASPQGLSDLSLRAAEIARTNAETQAIKAQTKKTEADTDTVLTYNTFQQSLLTNEINLGSVSVRLGLSNIKLTDAETRIAYRQAEKVVHEMDLLEAQIDELRSQGMLNDSQRFLNEIERAFKSSMMKAQIAEVVQRVNESKARISVSYAQVEQAYKNYLLASAGLEWEKDEKNPLNRLLNIQGDVSQLDLEIFSDDSFGTGTTFREWMWRSGIASDLIHGLGEAVGSCLSVRKAAAPGPVRVKGFGR
ncbi:MAG: hypothetical protein NC212_09480 [Staphylococcus sp.]|nr:hypothetical protein [Staphylococcus sp.]